MLREGKGLDQGDSPWSIEGRLWILRRANQQGDFEDITEEVFAVDDVTELPSNAAGLLRLRKVAGLTERPAKGDNSCG